MSKLYLMIVVAVISALPFAEALATYRP